MSAPARPVRAYLPARRPSFTERVEGGGMAALATVGCDPQNGEPLEVFLRPCGGARGGSAFEALCDDVAVIVSVAIQHGVPAAALARSVGRAPDGAAASVAGAAARLLAEHAARAASAGQLNLFRSPAVGDRTNEGEEG